MNSVEKQLHNRKIVFIISPQWFTRKGIGTPELSQFVSKGEYMRGYNLLHQKMSRPKNLRNAS